MLTILSTSEIQLIRQSGFELLRAKGRVLQAETLQWLGSWEYYHAVTVKKLYRLLPINSAEEYNMAIETRPSQGLQQVLEAVEALPEEEQWMVVEIIANRLRSLRRQQLVDEVEEARSAFQRGEVHRGNVDDLLRELGE